MMDRPSQIPALGHRIVIQKIDEVTASGLERRVALCGRLATARNDDLQLCRRDIERPPGRHGLDFSLAGPRRD